MPMSAPEFARQLKGAALDPDSDYARQMADFLRGKRPTPPLSPETLEALHRFNEACTELERYRTVRKARRLKEAAARKAEAKKAKAARRLTEQTIRLVEYQAGAVADDGGNVIRNCRLLGLVSKNRRRYLPEAVRDAVPMYEGAPVYLDHDWATHKGRPANRSVLDCFGKIRNVKVAQDGGLAGDLVYNPQHPFAAAFLWWIKNDPETVAFSHNAVGEIEADKDGVTVVRKISHVGSVDLVHKSASTKTLFN